MNEADKDMRQRAFVEAELRLVGATFVGMCAVRSQLAVLLHEATGTFWVTGDRLASLQRFTDAECTILERAHTKAFNELAREMGAFSPDPRPFHALRYVVDVITGKTES